MSEKGLFDIHCHIIPGVDDGAADEETSYKMLQMEYEQGVRNIIATPHFRRQMFETPYDVIEQQFHVLKRQAAQIAPDLKVYLGSEFRSNMEMLESFQNKEAHTMAGSRYVLIEFAGDAYSEYVRERIYALLSHGYRPIIAHIERYECMRRDISLVEDLADLGAYMQINADSVLGKAGLGTKLYCQKLCKMHLAAYIASDCHGTRERISRLSKAYDYIFKKYGESYADWIFIENPKKIIFDARSMALKK